MTETRRLAAIIAADVAGYSRLIDVDEEGTVAALRSHRRELIDPLVQSHGGRLANTAGDSLLLEFSSAVEAVRCAVAIQEGMSERNFHIPEDGRIYFRIGIHVGDVIVEGDDLLGDGVNIAARLEGLANSGGIYISGAAWDQVRDRLRIKVQDLGEVSVKNISRPVKTYRLMPNQNAADRLPRKIRKPQNIAQFLIATAGIIASLIGAYLYSIESKKDAFDERPSLAVLPFDVLGKSDDAAIVADTISYEISDQLTPMGLLRIVGRAATGRFHNRVYDPERDHATLRADYVLTGAMASAGDKGSLLVSLLSGGNGEQIWSSRFDISFEPNAVGSAINTIPPMVVSTIADETGIIAKTQQSWSDRPIFEINSYRCILLAFDYFSTVTTKAFSEALSCLEATVEREPEMAEAWGWLAILYGHQHAVFWLLPNEDPRPPLDKALTAGNRAVSIDYNSQIAWEGKAAAHFFRSEFDEFRLAANRAVEINPNDATTIANIGFYFAQIGDYEVGLPLIENALSLNPYPQSWYFWNHFARAYRQGDWDKALEFALKSDRTGILWPKIQLAAVYGQLGRKEKSQAAIAEAEKIFPGFFPFITTLNQKWHLPQSYTESVFDGVRLGGTLVPRNSHKISK